VLAFSTLTSTPPAARPLNRNLGFATSNLSAALGDNDRCRRSESGSNE